MSAEIELKHMPNYPNINIGAILANYPPCSTLYLPQSPLNESYKVKQVLEGRFSQLNETQKGQVYGKVWELAKMHDPRIEGADWGKAHAFDNLERLANALHRLGLFGNENLSPLQCLPFEFGEGGIGSQYFSLGEKLGRDPLTGNIGYVNGMGVTTLEDAGRDAAVFSSNFAHGNNIHCVYNSTHQKPMPNGDEQGFLADLYRMKALSEGNYAKTAYLLAQQWIDFLNANPDKNYLQLAHSEGAVHTYAALRLIKKARPDLLCRLRILNFCPGYFILPENFSNALQVLNLVKQQDTVIVKYVANSDKIGKSFHIRVVPHTHISDDPHNPLSVDFQTAAKPYIEEFMRSGNLY